MVTKSLLKKNMLKSSVQLMSISNELNAIPHVILSWAIMCTEANKELLEEIGVDMTAFQDASGRDLAVVIRAKDETSAVDALDAAETLLGAEDKKPSYADAGIDEALSKLKDANLALISVPGEQAAEVASLALARGLHIHLFSDNVTVEDEIALKKKAIENGLLMMGPGCGTAIISGVPLAFANVVRKGSIGLVSAAGTGLQEVTCLIHRFGGGISQAIGVGGRDTSKEVGGIMMLSAMEALEHDTQTEIIVLISKPPHPTVFTKVVEKAKTCSKPVIITLIGADRPEEQSQTGSRDESIRITHTLEDAAIEAVQRDGIPINTEDRQKNVVRLKTAANDAVSRMTKEQTYIRGVFVGGTLCAEALSILSRSTHPKLHSNITFRGVSRLEDANSSREDTCIDLGEEEFTKGRLHPMIDPSLRHLRIMKEVNDPETAVLLLDIVLGYGSHPDPAGALITLIEQLRAEKRDHHFAVVASVIGTDRDPQNRKYSVTRLEEAGILVAESNAEAVRIASYISQQLRMRGNNV